MKVIIPQIILKGVLMITLKIRLNFCAYNFLSHFNVSQIKLGKITIDEHSYPAYLIQYLFHSVNIQKWSQLFLN